MYRSQSVQQEIDHQENQKFIQETMNACKGKEEWDFSGKNLEYAYVCQIVAAYKADPVASSLEVLHIPGNQQEYWDAKEEFENEIQAYNDQLDKKVKKGLKIKNSQESFGTASTQSQATQTIVTQVSTTQTSNVEEVTLKRKRSNGISSPSDLENVDVPSLKFQKDMNNKKEETMQMLAEKQKLTKPTMPRKSIKI